MTNRARWHTPPTRPAHKAKDQENVPAGVLALDPQFSEKLDALERLLQKHGNPTSTPLGQADDFQLWAQYEREYPGQLTPKMQTPRYSYFLMAQLATADDVKAWLEEWRHAGLDLGPFAKTSFFASPNLAQQSPPHVCGFHAHLDETLPNGTIRHLHDTQVAANSDPTGAARIVLGDPYLGSGLDPTRLSGVVAPFRSTLEPYMACCGQPIGSKQNKNAIPPGCWIQMDPTQPAGQLVPYTVWFSNRADTRETWQAALEDRLVPIIQTRVQTGTAFIDPEYYAKLDRDIRALLVSLSGPIEAISNAVFDDNFDGPSPLSRLNDRQKEQVRLLVSLVDRYNAPQMGACHRILQRSDEEVEDLVFHTLKARALALRKELLKTVTIGGVKIPLVSLSNFESSLNVTIAKLKQVGLNSVGDALQNVAILAVAIVEAQQLLLERKARTEETQLPFDRAVNQIGIPNLFVPKRKYQNTLYEQARQVKEKLDALLQKLQEKTNDWLRSGASGTFSLPEPKNLKDTIAAAKTIEQEIEDLRTYYGKVRGILTMFNPTNEALRSVLTSDQQNYLNLPSVRLMAKLQLLLARFSKTEQKNVIDDNSRLDIEVAGTLSIEAQKAERAEAADRALRLELERAKEAEAARMQTEQVFDLPNNSRDNRALNLPEIRNIPASGPVVQGTAFRYEANSCPYDSFYVGLFKVPNQWFRNVVRRAQRVKIPSKRLDASERTCSDVDVLRLHNTLADGIDFVEKGTDEPQVCPLPAVWNVCMRTRAAGAGIQDDPIELFNALINFYQVQDSVQTLVTRDGKTYDEPILSGKEMLVVQVSSPESLLVGQRYPVPTTLRNGEYTIISSFYYTNEPRAQHFDSAVRDPRTGTWFLYRTSGRPEDPSEPQNPLEIRQPTKRSAAATYYFYPTAWIYVRTMALQSLMGGRPSIPENSFIIQFNTTFKNQPSTTDRVKIFGRENAAKGRGTPFTNADRSSIQDLQDPAKLGCLQLLLHLGNDVTTSNVTPVFENWTWPVTVEKVNSKIIPVLRSMIETWSIDGQSIEYRREQFLGVARAAKFVVLDGNGKWTVPAWSLDTTQSTNPLFIVPPNEWLDRGQGMRYFISLGEIWGYVLKYLLWLLFEETDRLRSDELREANEVIQRQIQVLRSTITGI